MDDLTRFRVQFQGVSQNWQQSFLRLGHKAIIAALHFRFRIRISYYIIKRRRLNIEWCFKRRQISHFLTPPCEN